jgi:hypothetical protein
LSVRTHTHIKVCQHGQGYRCLCPKRVGVDLCQLGYIGLRSGAKHATRQLARLAGSIPQTLEAPSSAGGSNHRWPAPVLLLKLHISFTVVRELLANALKRRYRSKF